MREFDTNQYIGLRYVAGGRDESGVDCWGLLRLIYEREFGIDLPGHNGTHADSADDFALAEYVAANRESWERVRDPLPGDAILLRLKGEPMHIGVVTAPGWFVHARADNDVVVEKYLSNRWSSRIDGFYRYAPKADGITVSGCPHPLRTARIESQSLAGDVLYDVILDHCSTANVPDELIKYGVAFLNGRRVEYADWSSVTLASGDRVEFRILPGKEGGGLRLILTIVVMVVAAWATAGASAAWGTGASGAAGVGAGTGISGGVVGALAGAAVTMVGNALVNAIAPLRPPQIGDGGDNGAAKPQYMLAGGQNLASPYAAFPVVLGHHDFTGPLGANSYISSNGHDRYLHLLIVWGYGPLDVSNLRIGTTPLTDYEDIDAYTLNGDAEEYVGGRLDWNNPEVAALLNVYASDLSQQSPEVELDTAWAERTTSETACTRLKVLLSFPQGLVRIDDDTGLKQTETVTVVFEYRRIGYFNSLGVWVPVVETWKDNWANIPGLGWHKASDHTGLDTKAIVVLRGSVLAVKSATAVWQFMSNQIVAPAWPTVAPGEILIHKIQNGTLISSHNTDLYTGFGVTFQTINTTKTETECDANGCWQVVTPASYQQFSVVGGISAGANIYSSANNDSFDSTLVIDVQTEPGQYEVRLRRTTVPLTDAAIADRVSDKVYWMMLTEEVQNRRPINPPKPMAMTALRIRATNQINGTLDGITATLASRQLVWNGVAWVYPSPSHRRNNNASLFLYVLLHPANAAPVPIAEIDTVKIGHWYEFCEEKGFVYENVITGTRPIRDVLADIAAAGRASIAMPDGKWSVVIDEPKATIVQHFTPHNSWGFEGSRTLPKLPHALRAKFLNRNRGGQPDEMLVYNDGYSADNATLIESIELPGVTEPGTAAEPGPIFKLARFHLEQLILRPEEYVINSDIESLICTRGDRVKASYDVAMWGLGSGRIKSVIGDVTGVELDEPFQMESGKNYTIRWRTATGASNTATITGADVFSTTLNFTTTVSANKPAAGDLIMFGELNLESVDCLVKSIEPTPGYQARLTLVDYAPAVFDAETKPFGTWSSQITKSPELPMLLTQRPIVELITTDETALTVVGNTVQSNILIRFSTSQGYGKSGAEAISPNVIEVETQILRSGSAGVPFKQLPKVAVYGGAIYIPADDKTSYNVRTRFVGRDGSAGPWTQLNNIYVIGKSTPPDNVENFQGRINASSIWLTYDPPAELDVTVGGDIVIRHASALSGVTWENSAGLFRGAASASGVSVPAMVGTYLAKFVDSVGNESLAATSLINEISTSLISMNVVDSMDDSPGWAGTHSSTVFDAGLSVISLEAEYLFDTVSDLDLVSDFDRYGGMWMSGTYELADSIDIGVVDTCRLSGALTYVCADSGIDVDSLVSFDTYPDMDGVLPSGSSAKIQIALSQDGTTYGDWTDLFAGEARFRKIKARLALSSTMPNINVRVSSASVTVDMPDRVEDGNDIVSGAAAYVVTYSRPFQIAPSVAITAQDMATGDYYAISAKTTDGFTVTFKNAAGTAISRTFDYVAKGY